MELREESEKLAASGIEKSYRGRKVVNGVDLEIFKGEIVGLLGPNGAGKTTTFYTIVGLVRPDTGQILFSERDITFLPMFERARLGISYLPQEPSVFRKLSVEDNIKAVLEVLPDFKGKKDLQKARAEELIEELKLQKIVRSYGYSLSGGERRRVEIARALASSPSFILLDEPFAGVDPLVVSELQILVRELKEKNIGILITDHNVREMLGICDRAYILSDGKVLESGSPELIAESEIARKHYLGESFRL